MDWLEGAARVSRMIGAIRFGFAISIVGILYIGAASSRGATEREMDKSMGRSIERIMVQEGFDLLPARGGTHSLKRRVSWFIGQDCSEPYAVLRHGITARSENYLSMNGIDGYETSVQFLDRHLESDNLASLFLTLVKNEIAKPFGATPFRSSGTLVLTATPQGCPVRELDFSEIWQVAER